MNIGQIRTIIADMDDQTPVVLHTEANEYHEVDIVKQAKGEAISGYSGAWLPPDEEEPSGKPQIDVLVIDNSW